MFSRRGIYATLAALALCLTPIRPANATAFAGVDRAYWAFRLFDPLSALDVDLQLTSVNSSSTSSGGGFAETGFDSGVGYDPSTQSFGGGQSGFGRSIVNGTGSAATFLDIVGVLSITNTTAFPVEFLDPSVDSIFFSAFNPGGNPVGASVDNPLREFASFESTVFVSDSFAGDQHGCTTSVSQPVCGVQTPDSSQNLFWFVLQPFETVSLDTELRIETEARVVSEPSATGLVCLAIMGLMAVYRRREGWSRA
jgi:hypothetical protein